MTQIAELAEQEAAFADAELTDEETELAKQLVAGEQMTPADAAAAVLAEREQPPAPEPPPPDEPPSGEPTAKQLKALENELVRHERRVHEVMGPFVAGFAACEQCGGVGLVAPGPQPREHEWFQPCDTCEGFGRVKTGSLNPEHAFRDCPRCAGRGYLEALDETGQPLARAGGGSYATIPAPAAPALEPGESPANGSQPETRFGTPAWMGDPNLGR